MAQILTHERFKSTTKKKKPALCPNIHKFKDLDFEKCAYCNKEMDDPMEIAAIGHSDGFMGADENFKPGHNALCWMPYSPKRIVVCNGCVSLLECRIMPDEVNPKKE